MSTIQIQSPAKYIQGPNELDNIALYAKYYSDSSAFVIIDQFILKAYGEQIKRSFVTHQFELFLEEFRGECSYSEIKRIQSEHLKTNAKVIIGIGGGKTLDTAKSVAFYTNLPMIMVPTAASTDAPTSAIAVIYTDEGKVQEYLLLKENPNLVLLDMDVVAKAPVRFLIAGIGDALATYFEARACHVANKPTFFGKLPSKTSMALAKLCYDTLMEDGLKAVLSAEVGISSQALMNIVEANTYLSGVGFESAGLAAAHGIHDGLLVISETHQFLHGEKVAFGTICQLVLENALSEEIVKIVKFCQVLGLPTTLEELGITYDVEEKVRKVAQESIKEDKTIHNMPFKVTEDMVMNAILVADKIGQTLLSRNAITCQRMNSGAGVI